MTVAILEDPELTSALDNVGQSSQFAQGQVTQGEHIAKNTVCLELMLGRVGFRRSMRSEAIMGKQAKPSDVHAAMSAEENLIIEELRASEETSNNVGTDPAFIHVSKDLIDRKEVRAIGKLDSQFKQRLAGRCVPTKMLRGGMYLLPLELVEQIDKELKDYEAKRLQLVEQFLSKYDDIKADAQKRLAEHFDPREYPNAAEIRLAYTVAARYLSFNVPAALQQINHQLYQREKEKVERQWGEAASEIQDALRVGFAQLVGDMVEKLGTDAESGKPKVFRDSMVEKMNDFLTVFEARNLTNDAELQALTQKAREVMTGAKPGELRKDEALRAYVQENFAQIKEQMAGMVTHQKERKFSFDEDV